MLLSQLVSDIDTLISNLGFNVQMGKGEFKESVAKFKEEVYERGFLKEESNIKISGFSLELTFDDRHIMFVSKRQNSLKSVFDFSKLKDLKVEVLNGSAEILYYLKCIKEWEKNIQQCERNLKGDLLDDVKNYLQIELKESKEELLEVQQKYAEAYSSASEDVQHLANYVEAVKYFNQY